jgi:hypothetical protein
MTTAGSFMSGGVLGYVIGLGMGAFKVINFNNLQFILQKLTVMMIRQAEQCVGKICAASTRWW